MYMLMFYSVHNEFKCLAHARDAFIWNKKKRKEKENTASSSLFHVPASHIVAASFNDDKPCVHCV